MAHEIDFSRGTAAVFTAGQPAWHGLGRNVADAATSQEAIRLAELDWEVVQWPVQAVGPDAWGTLTVRGFVANIRADVKNVLGVVSRKYRPFQNREAFSFCDAIVGEGRARYDTAGALRGGRRVWMLLRMPEELKVGRADVIRPFLLVHNTHDGSSSLRVVLTGVRVVCQNTLALALSQSRGEGLLIRHRGNLQARVDDARRVLGLARDRLKTFGREVEVMRSVPMTGGRLQRYFDDLLPPLRGGDATDRERANRLRVLDRLHANFGNPMNTLPGMTGTLWGALNAATEFADHERGFRGASPAARAENRLHSIWFGDSAAFKAAAYRAALDLAVMN